MTSRPVKIMENLLMKTMVSSGTRHSLATRGRRWAEKSQILLVCITQEHSVHTTSWPERRWQQMKLKEDTYISIDVHTWISAHCCKCGFRKAFVDALSVYVHLVQSLKKKWKYLDLYQSGDNMSATKDSNTDKEKEIIWVHFHFYIITLISFLLLQQYIFVTVTMLFLLSLAFTVQ